MHRLLLKLIRRRRVHDDLEAELAFHREMARAHGNSIPLGNVSRITEESLDLWRFARVENLWRDAIYGARTLARSHRGVPFSSSRGGSGPSSGSGHGGDDLPPAGAATAA